MAHAALFEVISHSRVLKDSALLEQEEERKNVFGAHIEDFKHRIELKKFLIYLHVVKTEIKVFHI